MTEETLFAAALEKSAPADRAAFLDAACGGDAALRRRVEALLASHADPAFLATPAVPRPADGPDAGDTRTGPNAADGGEPLDFLDPSARPDALGRLGHYEVLEVVGRGGMGVVLRAFDEKLHRVVALKVMAPALAASATARKRFVREARAAAAVSHDHVVTIHAVEDAGPLPFIVMQFVVGQSLQERIDKTGPLQVAEVLRIGMQAARGLEAAHAQGLVHRDVKPANILLENGVERVKLTDFGLARAADDASLTQSGTVAGTPAFMSPEQAEGRPVDARSDLFSLGSVLYAMCAGRPPFRAPGSMAVLKRVCEDTPAPVREANPEVPADLAALIAELHAKDPAARPASAAAAADRLAGLLAAYQHPTGAALPRAAAPRVANVATPARRRGRWAVAAVAAALLFAGLGVTEAAGVTKLRATVIRVFTPDGTLVVEADDPDVKVTVEGDGGLVITGAGAQEVRVRPGNYKVQAVKAGRPVSLDRDVVTISKGDKQVVRVRVEGTAAGPAAVAPAGERGAFVVLGGKGLAERKFDTLSDAVRRATDGDTIEIRGNGPFETDPIRIDGPALTIRSGAGFRPAIRLSQNAPVEMDSLLFTSSPLVLEGLDLELRSRENSATLVRADGRAMLAVANCRFRVTGALWQTCIHLLSGRLSVQNSLFICPGSHSFIGCPDTVVENCVHLGRHFFIVPDYYCESNPTYRLFRNTVVATDASTSQAAVQFQLTRARSEGDRGTGRVDAAGNVFAVRTAIRFDQLGEFSVKAGTRVGPREEEKLLPRLLSWRDQANVYSTGGTSVSWHSDRITLGQVADWKAYWTQGDGEITEGAVKFVGGNLTARAETEAGKVTPADFRLRPDSAGYKAGKDGKDVGADVDMVGPGAAYERWKKSPDYQQWLKDSGQVKK